MSERPIIVAHRGGSALAPENTVTAFRHAWGLGIRWMECDVRLTRDGHPAVIHDPAVDRTTQGQGLVAELTLAELQQLESSHPAGADARIPTLAEALAALPEDARWLIELKPDEQRFEAVAAAALAAVRASGGEERVRLISFQEAMLGAVRAADAAMPLGYLTARDLDMALASAPRFGCEAMMLEKGMITPEGVERCHAAGFRVGGWTANHPAQVARLVAAGVDELITDDPELALRELGR